MITKKKTLRILHLEDLPSDVELIARELRKAGLHFETFVANDAESFKNGLTEFGPDIILSDHSLPGFNSLDALRLVRSKKKYIHK